MVISQNGPALRKCADHIESIRKEFERLYEQMYEEVDRNLGTPDEQSKNWYGPRAIGCKNLINKAKPQFFEMRKDLQQLADTLNQQVTAWGRQQSSKY